MIIATIQEFLDRYRSDRESGRVLPLGGYLEGVDQLALQAAITREYVALEAENTQVECEPAFDRESRFGPYRIVKELGRGGQGVVYLAEESKLHRMVALKVLRNARRADQEEILRRFQREAEIAGRLDHPGICGIHAAGILQGTAYIAMKFVEGRTLAQIISDSRRTEQHTIRLAFDVDTNPEQLAAIEHAAESPSGPSTKAELLSVVAIIEKTARALQVAHEAGIIHRDIKPANIMVSPEGEPVILDFGLARDEEILHSELTKTGDLFGTPQYMSPEQISGHNRIKLDWRTDVYSLGVSLYECLTLLKPFDAPTRQLLYEAIQFKPLPDPRLKNPSISRDLKIVLETALERDRDRRYQTALDFADDLRRIRTLEPIAARPAGLILRLRRWAQRNPIAATATVASFLFLTVALSILSVMLISLRDSQKETLRAKEVAESSNLELTIHRDRLLAQGLVRRELALWATENLSEYDQWLTDFQGLESRSRLADSELERETLEMMPRLRILAADIIKRRKSADGITRTVEARASDWTRTCELIADETRNPRYQGLEMSPIKGLVPVGQDRVSRLFEFALLGSGGVPVREAEGHVACAPDDAIVFVLVPPGVLEVRLGDRNLPGRMTPQAKAAENEMEIVRLDAFLISKFEVTQAQWERVMGSNPSHYQSGSTPSGTDSAGGVVITSTHPVEMVSWKDASEFCLRFGISLPTQAQWEYAYRARTTTTWFADSLQGYANLADPDSKSVLPDMVPEPDFKDGHAVHAPVGSFRPNAYGLHDMAGNVWEFCLDQAGPYFGRPARARDGLRDPGTDPMIIARGGSFYFSAKAATAKQYNSVHQDYKNSDCGFRVCINLEAP